MEINPNDSLYQDFKEQCYTLEIPEDMHDSVIAMIDYPTYDMCIHKSFVGDERMQQFVILAYNNLVRELHLEEDGYSYLEMAPIPPDECYIAPDFQLNY